MNPTTRTFTWSTTNLHGVSDTAGLIYVSWDGDRLASRVAGAIRRNEPEEARRISYEIECGNHAFTAWALAARGSVVFAEGDAGVVLVPADQLVDLDAVREKYESATGAPVSIGVGARTSEAARALLVAKHHGGDQVVVYDEQVEAQAVEAEREVPGGDEPAMGKSEPVSAPDLACAQPPVPTDDPPSAAPEQPIADAVPQQGSLQDRVRAQVAARAATDQERLRHDATAADEVRDRLAGILRRVGGNPDELRALVQAAPGVADVLTELIGTVRDLSRTMPRMAKAEPVEKAIGKIRAGKEMGAPTEIEGGARVARSFDYSHVLRPAQRQAGYAIEVEHSRPTDPENEGLVHSITAHVSHKGKAIGNVVGYVHPTHRPSDGAGLEPHSRLDAGHQGRGLGKAMYEALFAHAMRNGVTHVVGGIHSAAASHVHQSLAAKHGLDYQPDWPAEESDGMPDEDVPEDEREPSGREAGPYGYVLKGEVAPGPDEDHLLIGPGRGAIFMRRGVAAIHKADPSAPPAPAGPRRQAGRGLGAEAGREHVVLPVGSVRAGRTKVPLSTSGGQGWREMRAGSVAAPDGTATSARHPNPKTGQLQIG